MDKHPLMIRRRRIKYDHPMYGHPLMNDPVAGKLYSLHDNWPAGTYLALLKNAPNLGDMANLMVEAAGWSYFQESSWISKIWWRGRTATQQLQDASAFRWVVGKAGRIPIGGSVIGGIPIPFRGVAPISDQSIKAVLGVGAQGSGKSAGLTAPTILGWKGSAIVFGQWDALWPKTAQRRARSGNKVVVFASSYHHLDTFNFLDFIRLQTPSERDDAAILSELMLFGSIPENQSDAALAKQMLVGLLLQEANSGGTLTKLAESLDLPETRDVASRFARPACFTHEGQWEQNVDQAMRAVKNALEPFLSPEIAKNTGKSTFSLDDLINPSQPCTLYASAAPDNEQTQVARLLVDLAAARVHSSETYPAGPVLLVVEPAERLPALHSLNQWAAGGYPRVKPYITVRSLFALARHYPLTRFIDLRSTNIVCTGVTNWEDAQLLASLSENFRAEEMIHLPGLQPVGHAVLLSADIEPGRGYWSQWRMTVVLPRFFRTMELSQYREWQPYGGESARTAKWLRVVFHGAAPTEE